MFRDPVFILALLSVFTLIGVWIYKVLDKTLTDQTQQILYIVGFLFALLGIYRIFVNAGDLGTVLFIGSFICLFILIIGLYRNNALLKSTGRGWFFPVFIIFVLRTLSTNPIKFPQAR